MVKGQWLTGNGYTLAVFLPVCCTSNQGSGEYEEMSVYGSSTTLRLDSDVRVSTGSVGRERKMRILQEGLQVVVRPVQEYVLKGFCFEVQGVGLMAMRIVTGIVLS